MNAHRSRVLGDDGPDGVLARPGPETERHSLPVVGPIPRVVRQFEGSTVKAHTITRSRVDTWDETTLELTSEETETVDAIFQAITGNHEGRVNRLTLLSDNGHAVSVGLVRAERKVVP